MCSAGVFIYCP